MSRVSGRQLNIVARRFVACGLCVALGGFGIAPAVAVADPQDPTSIVEGGSEIDVNPGEQTPSGDSSSNTTKPTKPSKASKDKDKKSSKETAVQKKA